MPPCMCTVGNEARTIPPAQVDHNEARTIPPAQVVHHEARTIPPALVSGYYSRFTVGVQLAS